MKVRKILLLMIFSAITITSYVYADLPSKEAVEYVRKSNTLIAESKFDDAIKLLQQVIGLDNKYSDAYEFLSKAYFGQGKHEDALIFINKAIFLKKELRYYLYKSNIQIRRNNYDLANLALDEAIELDPEYATAYILKADLLSFHMERYYEAERYYNKYNELLANRYEYYSGMCYLKYSMGKHDKAIEYADEAIRINPNGVNGYNNKGLALFAKSNYSDAEKCFDKVIELDPNFALAYSNKGVVNIEIMKYDLALECFNKAIMIEPDNDMYYVNRALCLSNLERYDETILNYDAALALNPNYDKLHVFKGLVFKDDLHKNNEALKCFNEYLKKYPNDYSVISFIVDIYMGENQPEKVINYYDHLIATGTFSPLCRLYFAKGDYLSDCGREEEAIKCYEAILKLDIIDYYYGHAKYRMACSYAKLKDADNTMMYLRAAIQNNEGGIIFRCDAIMNPDFEILKSNSEYKELVGDVKNESGTYIYRPDIFINYEKEKEGLGKTL